MSNISIASSKILRRGRYWHVECMSYVDREGYNVSHDGGCIRDP
jgi:hypothetical protein